MGNKFIYVFNKEACDVLTTMGYILIQSDYRNSIFVFANDQSKDITKADISYILSDTITL